MMGDIPDHELAFHFKSGRLCLDFTATVGERWRRSVERLREPSDLGRWLVDTGLVACTPPVTEGELAAGRSLREAIYRTAKPAGSRRPDPDDVGEINGWAARMPLAPRLGVDGRTASRWADRPVEAALATIARDAIDLFSGPLADRVRECARPDCALLFVDRSRPGRRRWCAMAECGNRTKTTAYRRRRKSMTTEGGR